MINDDRAKLSRTTMTKRMAYIRDREIHQRSLHMFTY